MLPRDPWMLLSWVNMKLRDQYDSLETLCDDLDVMMDDIVVPLTDLGYIYDISQNQFK